MIIIDYKRLQIWLLWQLGLMLSVAVYKGEKDLIISFLCFDICININKKENECN